MIPAELRGPLLGLDEDEGANFLSNGGHSHYHSLQFSLQRRFNRGYMFNVNYTLVEVDGHLLGRRPVPDRARPDAVPS